MERALLAPRYLWLASLRGPKGYCEAIRSGLHVAINVAAMLESKGDFIPSKETVFGALLDYATNKDTIDYQPMHVNFGIIAPLEESIKKKQLRYAKYQQRGTEALTAYVAKLKEAGLHPCKDTP